MIPMRVWLGAGLLALAYLQARLWLLPNNYWDLSEAQQRLELAQTQNQAQAERNAQTEAWIRLLEQDPASIEFQARYELGLVRPGETYFLIAQ